MIVRFVNWLYLKLTPNIPFTALNTALRKLDRRTESVLDLGCGRGRTARSVKQLVCCLVGLDIHPPCLVECRENGNYDDLVRGNVMRPPFKAKSYDTVWCLEVLEHQNKEDGLRLIQQMETIARRQVILSTPEGDYPHEEEDNEFQEHLSEWSAAELQALGYKVYGHGNKWLRGTIEFGTRFPIWLKPFVFAIWVLSGPFVYYRPGCSGDMVAVKKLDG